MLITCGIPWGKAFVWRCCLLHGHNKVVCGAVGPPPLSVIFGQTLPLNVSAGAKVILAFSDPEFTESMINGDFTKITDNTITDPEVFKAQLEEIRQQGIAYEHAEFDAEVHAASVAVFNHLKKPVAALTICVPANRAHKIDKFQEYRIIEKNSNDDIRPAVLRNSQKAVADGIACTCPEHVPRNPYQPGGVGEEDCRDSGSQVISDQIDCAGAINFCRLRSKSGIKNIGRNRD